MTKKEIVRDICQRANDEQLIAKGSLTQLATKEIVQWTLAAIIETLVKEGRIELRNFGVFEVKQRKPRKARNPRTGDPVNVEAKNVVTFQPGKEMEEKVRTLAKLAEQKKKKKTKKGKGTDAKPPHDGKPHEGKPAELSETAAIAKTKNNGAAALQSGSVGSRIATEAPGTAS